jgi:hypothetical protein
MNALEVAAAIIVPAIALLGGVTAVLKLAYSRGGDEREWKTALDNNTASNKELSGQLGAFKDFTVDKLHAQSIDHERLAARVDVVETRVNVIEQQIKG